ncbi:MAG: M61 family metallopeptidase, partial [Myxococcaceae bacterium]
MHYRVELTNPHAHLVEIEARFPCSGPTLDLVLPVWTPGSYLVREYARHVQGVTATGSGQPHPTDATGNGQALRVERTDKRTFRVHCEGASAVVVRYRVYANELSVRTSHFDDSHAALNGASLFLYSEALRDQPHRVEIVAPESWTTFVALPFENNAYVAKDYDELVDSPFEVGPHQPIEFVAAGVPHQAVFWGGETLDVTRVKAELKRVCEQEAKLFGGLPMQRYLFLVYLTERGRGGLEHQASTALLFSRSAISTPKGWEDFLTLVAHEYFHLWNVKRIKPKAFVPFDYAQEQYTQLLWAFEGTTSYYDNLFVRRAGLMSANRYLARLGETVTSLQTTPGRKTQTLADASLVAWIKQYRPDESSVNTAISYYLKGELVSLLLDLTLRAATQDAKGLDDLMRLLWQRYGDGRGVPED